MQNKCEDITHNLSSNPIEREQQLYNRILDLFIQFKILKKDTTTWEGKTYIELMKLLKKDDQNLTQAVWNAILLILALFPAREESLDSYGTELKNLDKYEQKQIQMLLRELFPAENETNCT